MLYLSQFSWQHGLRTPREKIAFTARPKIQSQSQFFRYGQSIFCLPHRPKFSDIFDLCLHWVSVVHDGMKSHICHICDFKTSLVGNLNKHIESVHEGKKPYKCSICDFSCSLNGNLKQHIQSVHEKKKSYKCTICDYMTSSNSILNNILNPFMRERNHTNA